MVTHKELRDHHTIYKTALHCAEKHGNWSRRIEDARRRCEPSNIVVPFLGPPVFTICISLCGHRLSGSVYSVCSRLVCSQIKLDTSTVITP